MKNIITVMLLMCFTCISAQNTSLVVDNQNPGWLSNKIPFKDQESVKNLTVTGYINGTDIKFIRELISNRALTHLDLTKANIVAGGEDYFKSYKVKEDNTLYNEMFSGKANGMDYLALPLSITKIEALPNESYRENSFYDKVDTLIIGGSINMLSKYYIRNHIKYLYIREGVDSIQPYRYRIEQFKKIHLPKTLKSLGEYTFYCDTIDINLDNLYFIGHGAIKGTLVGDTIRFSKGISTIYTCSFGLNKGTTLFIPKNVTKIDRSCVSGHHYNHDESFFLGLKIHLESPTPPLISNSGYWDDFLSSSTIYVPKGSIDTYKKAKYWSYATILEEKVPVTGITLDQENISFSDIGASVQLTATILPTDADNQKVIWKSSDTNVATVKDGKVTCTGYGTAIITATSEEGEYVATCNVTATKRIVLPSSITLDRNEATIKVGEATTLKANVLPADADDKTIVWSSENSDIASVTNDGVVTGMKAGTTKIIVTTNANGLKDECILTVLQPATGITLDRQEISFANIGETVQLTANVLPEDASNKNVSWASSDTKVAIVSNGKVVCTGYGTAVISAVAEDGGYMATCIITANKNVILPSSITLDKSDATINVGESFTLNANVLPDNADNKIIVWNSDDADIASVNNEGEVTGIKAGTTKIIAMTQANDLKAECLITVLQPVTGITLDRNDISFVEIGESVQLIANVLPEDASNKNVVWTSSDANVATVNNGVVVCMGYGSAVITASTEDGGYKAICVINATSGIAGINDGNKCNEIKRYDATGREIKNPVNGLNIIKTQDGRVIKTTVRIK